LLLREVAHRSGAAIPSARKLCPSRTFSRPAFCYRLLAFIARGRARVAGHQLGLQEEAHHGGSIHYRRWSRSKKQGRCATKRSRQVARWLNNSGNKLLFIN
jgi:hypothetical protein